MRRMLVALLSAGLTLGMTGVAAATDTPWVELKGPHPLQLSRTPAKMVADFGGPQGPAVAWFCIQATYDKAPKVDKPVVIRFKDGRLLTKLTGTETRETCVFGNVKSGVARFRDGREPLYFTGTGVIRSVRAYLSVA